MEVEEVIRKIEDGICEVVNTSVKNEKNKFYSAWDNNIQKSWNRLKAP